MDYVFKENDFNALLAKYGLNKVKFCEIMHMSMPTLRSRLENNGNFSRNEIIKMFEVFSEKEVIDLLFAS